MSENQSLLEQLEQMLHWKKSKKFYANKLGVTETEIDELLIDIKKREKAEEDELENCLPDNVAPHHWGEDRILSRIGPLVKKSLRWFFCC